MSKFEDTVEDSRREFLLRLLATGAYAGLAPMSTTADKCLG